MKPEGICELFEDWQEHHQKSSVRTRGPTSHFIYPNREAIREKKVIDANKALAKATSKEVREIKKLETVTLFFQNVSTTTISEQEYRYKFAVLTDRGNIYNPYEYDSDEDVYPNPKHYIRTFIEEILRNDPIGGFEDARNLLINFKKSIWCEFGPSTYELPKSVRNLVTFPQTWSSLVSWKEWFSSFFKKIPQPIQNCRAILPKDLNMNELSENDVEKKLNQIHSELQDTLKIPETHVVLKGFYNHFRSKFSNMIAALNLAKEVTPRNDIRNLASFQ